MQLLSLCGIINQLHVLNVMKSMLVVGLDSSTCGQCCHSKQIENPRRATEKTPGKPQVKFVQILGKNRTFPRENRTFSRENRTFSQKSGFFSQKCLITFFSHQP